MKIGHDRLEPRRVHHTRWQYNERSRYLQSGHVRLLNRIREKYISSIYTWELHRHIAYLDKHKLQAPGSDGWIPLFSQRIDHRFVAEIRPG